MIPELHKIIRKYDIAVPLEAFSRSVQAKSNENNQQAPVSFAQAAGVNAHVSSFVQAAAANPGPFSNIQFD